MPKNTTVKWELAIGVSFKQGKERSKLVILSLISSYHNNNYNNP